VESLSICLFNPLVSNHYLDAYKKMKLLVLSLTILVLVAAYLLEEHSKYWTGIVATLPTKLTAVMVMVYFARRNTMDVVEVNQGMIIGVIASAFFVLVIVVALKQNLSLLQALMVGYGVWIGTTYLGRLIS